MKPSRCPVGMHDWRPAKDADDGSEIIDARAVVSARRDRRMRPLAADGSAGARTVETSKDRSLCRRRSITFPSALLSRSEPQPLDRHWHPVGKNGEPQPGLAQLALDDLAEVVNVNSLPTSRTAVPNKSRAAQVHGPRGEPRSPEQGTGPDIKQSLAQEWRTCSGKRSRTASLRGACLSVVGCQRGPQRGRPLGAGRRRLSLAG